MIPGCRALLGLGLALATALTANVASAEPRIYLTSHFKVIADGKEVHCSWWSSRCDFGNYFDENPEAKTEYEQYQNIASWTPWFHWAAVVGLLAYGIVELGTDHNFDAGTGFAIFLVPWISGGVVAGHAAHHLFRAVNLMNGVTPDMAALDSERHRYATNFSTGLIGFTF